MSVSVQQQRGKALASTTQTTYTLHSPSPIASQILHGCTTWIIQSAILHTDSRRSCLPLRDFHAPGWCSWLQLYPPSGKQELRPDMMRLVAYLAADLLDLQVQETVSPSALDTDASKHCSPELGCKTVTWGLNGSHAWPAAATDRHARAGQMFQSRASRWSASATSAFQGFRYSSSISAILNGGQHSATGRAGLDLHLPAQVLRWEGRNHSLDGFLLVAQVPSHRHVWPRVLSSAGHSGQPHPAPLAKLLRSEPTPADKGHSQDARPTRQVLSFCAVRLAILDTRWHCQGQY